jgi:hypothetical protein
MSAKITNVGELRMFLANMMVGVRDGDIKVDEAARIVKLAEKINENYYAEIKRAEIALELGRVVPEFGKLPVEG